MTTTECYSTSTTHRMRYLDSGHDQSGNSDLTVVLLHDGAWGGDADTTWTRMLTCMPSGMRVIAPDLLGFGRSDKVVYLDRSPYDFRAMAIFDLLDELGIEYPVDLVGSSFGGSVALRALQVFGIADRIRSVTSISGTGGPWRTPTAMSELGRFDGTVEDMDRIVGHLTEPFQGYKQYLSRRVESALVPGHYQCMMAPHARLPESIRTQRADDQYPGVLSSSTTPLHLIAGDRDVLVEHGWAERIADLHGGMSHVTHLDASHSPNLSHPAETWTEVEPFLRRVG